MSPVQIGGPCHQSARIKRCRGVVENDPERAIHLAHEGERFLHVAHLSLGIGEPHQSHGVGCVAEQLDHVILHLTACPMAVGGKALVLAERGNGGIRTHELGQSPSRVERKVSGPVV